jgi:hypothetical protein
MLRIVNSLGAVISYLFALRPLMSLLPSSSGRRAGDEGLRAYLYFLFVLRVRRVAFNDNTINRVDDASVSPHPNPLPMGEGDNISKPNAPKYNRVLIGSMDQ